MQLKTRVVKGLMLVIVAGSALWVGALFLALGNIYLSHAIPYSFNEWIVNVQIRNNYRPGQQPYSPLFYVVRFYAVTTVIICGGAFSASYLKRMGQRGNRTGGPG